MHHDASCMHVCWMSQAAEPETEDIKVRQTYNILVSLHVFVFLCYLCGYEVVIPFPKNMPTLQAALAKGVGNEGSKDLMRVKCLNTSCSISPMSGHTS